MQMWRNLTELAAKEDVMSAAKALAIMDLDAGGVTKEVMKKQFRKLAIRYHPDKVRDARELSHRFTFIVNHHC